MCVCVYVCVCVRVCCIISTYIPNNFLEKFHILLYETYQDFLIFSWIFYNQNGCY